jgi:hypothetical protein
VTAVRRSQHRVRWMEDGHRWRACEPEDGRWRRAPDRANRGQAALWMHGPRRWQPAGPASAWAAATTGTQHGRGRATSCRELTAGRGGQLLAGEGDITRVERARAAIDRRRHVSVVGQGARMEEPGWRWWQGGPVGGGLVPVAVAAVAGRTSGGSTLERV